MGACCSKEQSPVDVTPRHHVSDSDSGASEDPPAFIRYPPRTTMIDQYIMQMVHMVGSVSQSFDDQPAPLIRIHSIADKDEGWQRVIESLVNTVPLSQPLGPSAITIIFDDCPLPAVNTVVDALQKFGLGRVRALSCHNGDDNKRFERNMLVVLGCMAEKFAGPISSKLLSHELMEYLFTFLIDHRVPDLVLHALITLEKFAKTKDNKATLQAYFAMQEDQNPLVRLERHCGSEDILWRQVGFNARWLLDNMFFVPGRQLSYTTVNMTDIKAILDCKDTTDFLKISSDGLDARCDSHTFESVRCTFQVDEGCWYYEVEILTPGVMQIGWATKKTKFSTQEGYGIGDDHFSLAYDGCRRLLWHKAAPKICDVVEPWAPGDILGCLIDISAQEAIFSLNGVRLPICKDIFNKIKPVPEIEFSNSSVGFFAAASFMCFQGAHFNFGLNAFRYAPSDREFKTFNDHGILSDEDKQVIPRWLYLERLQILQTTDTEDDEDSVCAICYDKTPDTVFSPCRHRGFCRECALRLTECPMCRERVWHIMLLPL